MKPLFKMLAPKMPAGDEEDALMLSITRAFNDFQNLDDFIAETWMHDPMIQAKILGEAYVPPERPLRTIAQEQAKAAWEAKNKTAEPQKLQIAPALPRPTMEGEISHDLS